MNWNTAEQKGNEGEKHGSLMKDSTTLDILVQLNRRFESGDAIIEMVALQKEFNVFSSEHSLQQSFALLSLVTRDWSERKRWKTYDSDKDGVNGHDRVIQAIAEELASETPKPVTIRCHSAKDHPTVTVSTGMPVIFSLDEHVVISIPTTPGREIRQQNAQAARQRRQVGGRDADQPSSAEPHQE
jgi:hypothetical protein